MNYIIYDLEFNQKYPSDSENAKYNNPNLSFEIIQIGAFKLNKNLKILSTFNTLVKPTVYTTIHPYVENLTKITTKQVVLNNTFPEVYNDFLKFIGNGDSILCTWGLSDIKELMQNIKFHSLNTSLIPKKYIDIQKFASRYLDAPKGTKIGLKNAVELLNITTEGEFHDAFNDAHYTYEVFKKIFNNNIEPQIYEYSRNDRKSTKPKAQINTSALISQFEKIYNRKMSNEECLMIKLSDIMGKTNQFTK